MKVILMAVRVRKRKTEEESKGLKKFVSNGVKGAINGAVEGATKGAIKGILKGNPVGGVIQGVMTGAAQGAAKNILFGSKSNDKQNNHTYSSHATVSTPLPNAQIEPVERNVVEPEISESSKESSNITEKEISQQNDNFNVERRFYQKTWFIVIMLFISLPIGTILALINPFYPSKPRKIVGGILIAITLYAMIKHLFIEIFG